MEGLLVYNVVVLVLQILLPVLLAILLGGVFAGILQGVTQISDHIIGFTARFACGVFALYLLSGSIIARVSTLTGNCWSIYH